MNKLDLNYKIATLYEVDPYLQCMVGFDINEGNIYKYIPFIDDWNRLMPLALEHDIWIQPYKSLGFLYAHVRKDLIFDAVFYKDHKSPDDASKYAIAMALVKLAESKLCTTIC